LYIIVFIDLNFLSTGGLFARETSSSYILSFSFAGFCCNGSMATSALKYSSWFYSLFRFWIISSEDESRFGRWELAF
jgi:hypothetical protein